MYPRKNNQPYIWQYPQWPQLTFDHSAVINALTTACSLHGELMGLMKMVGFDSSMEACAEAMANDLTASSLIEGIELNADSVRSSIARRLDLPITNPSAESHYVEALVDVMFDAMSELSQPLTHQRLKDWHTALFPGGYSGRYHITVGEYRQGEEPMRVVSGAFGHEHVHYQAPPSADVPAEMERFLQWFNSTDLHPVLKAAVAHLWFVSIHPFDDGNGRITRTISERCLAALAPNQPRFYSLSAQINRRKSEYYAQLEAAQHGTCDITDWVLWFINCFGEAQRFGIEAVNQTLRKAQYWVVFKHVTVNERQRKVINRLWDNFEDVLTTSKWAKMCHCSQDTALRDITDLLEKGMLERAPSSARKAHYLLPTDFSSHWG